MSTTRISYGELADIVGFDAASVLTRLRGGVSLYIPVRAAPEAELAPIIGLPALRSLCAAYGGTSITVPNGRREAPKKTDALALLDMGCSPGDIALQLGLTERYVRHLAATARPRARQLSLF